MVGARHIPLAQSQQAKLSEWPDSQGREKIMNYRAGLKREGGNEATQRTRRCNE